jgi:hypothetical protein
LILFEAVVGVLMLVDGRRAQLGMLGILGMQACLLLFGWVLTAFGTVMLPAVGLLLRAQLRHDRGRTATGPRGLRQRGDARGKIPM